jgi:signal recognition particle subunit SRP54
MLRRPPGRRLLYHIRTAARARPVRYVRRPMLETLSRGFETARDRLRGVQTLGEANVDEALRDVRTALLEADVDLGVTRDFLARVKERALGEKVETKARDAAGRLIRVTPGQHFVKACQDELTALMGPVDPSLARDAAKITSVMLLGLQGVGKTTVAGKLARHLQRGKQRPLLVAADVQRPAAVLQLQQLGAQLGVAVHVGEQGERAPAICARAAERARREGFDAVVYDTAGRLAVDDELMAELLEVRNAVQPANALLVCDALMGRDAVSVARAFAERIPLDGLVLTKLDGDARGGAALAVKAATGVPIKFIGTGESLDRLEPFRPEGLASRILGMGDIVGLVSDFEQVVDQQKAEEDAERLLKGQFTMDDLLTQLRTIQKMGPLREVFAKLPMFGGLADQVDGSELGRVEAMIQSMTRSERRDPDLFVREKRRLARVANGCGRAPKEVSELVKRFNQMRDMMSALGAKGGLLSKIPGLGRFAGAGAGAGGMGGLAGLDPSAVLGGGPGMGAMGGGGSAMRGPRRNAKSDKRKRKQAMMDRRKGRRR